MQTLHTLTLLILRLLRSRRASSWLIWGVQIALIAIGGVTAFLLRFEFTVPGYMTASMWTGIGVWLVVKTASFRVFRLGHGVWRYFSTPDLARVAAANVVGSLASALVLVYVPVTIPRSVAMIDFVLCLMLTAGVRAATRVVLDVASVSRVPGRRRTFIYGAGGAGVSLLREGRSQSGFPYRVCGFIDDDPAKRGLRVAGIPVVGLGAELAGLAAEHGVTDVLIAVPSAKGRQMARIIEQCRAAGLTFRTIPGLSEILAGRLAPQIREVAVEDVLGRSTVELDHGRINDKLRGKVVLVTGAAGSIGAELCRQIARFHPAALVAFEMAESALFDLEQEMQRSYPDVLFHPEIGSVQNVQRLRETFEQHSPAVVYHAAAYKHVPMMETHVFEAVENNVLGTFNVATVAADCDVEDFVMISSDKAVRPTSMMGVTKRVAELVIRSLQNGGPRYISVRFGNVLGSNGSVVPTFKRQIAAGGPVTVTHPEMRRYFMTIPEAAQLVLQASTMGKGGEIFVLDMGEPVRIADLARQLIELSGLRPDEDVRIEYCGVRPGEKLYEELSSDGEAVVATYHHKIKVFAGLCLPAATALQRLALLRAACARRDLAALLLELKDLVPDYSPSQQLLNQVASPGLARMAAAVGDSVAVELPALSQVSVPVPAEM